jgi:hypothetical protein
MASDAQVVLGATEALNEAAETGELRSMIETWLDPEFEYFPPPGVPEPGPYRGHDEMEAFYRYFRNQFDRIRISGKDVSGNQRPGHLLAEHRGSGKGERRRGRRQFVLRCDRAGRSPVADRRRL